MEVPLKVSFHGLDPSEAVEARARERIVRLERHHGRITSCRVVIDSGHRHARKGPLYKVAIDIGVPGATLVVDRAPDAAQDHADMYVALRDAFDAMDRKLAEHVRRLRDAGKRGGEI